MNNERILTYNDAATIANLSERLLRLAATQTNLGEQLLDLLAISTILPPGIHDPLHVALYAEIRYVELASDQEHTITIVPPQEGDPSRGNISILTPVAIALMGCRIGAVVTAPLPFGRTQALMLTSLCGNDYSLATEER